MEVAARPREIVETTVTRWVPVVGGTPRSCACGHLHYPRVPEPNRRNLAPQWNYCEEAGCGCWAFRIKVRQPLPVSKSCSKNLKGWHQFQRETRTREGVLEDRMICVCGDVLHDWDSG